MGNPSLIALLIVCFAGTARATAPVDTPPGVVFEDCQDAPLGTAAFLRALGVELGNSPSSASDREAPRIAVRFGCNGVATIRITVGQSSEERDVRLDDVPAAERPRALALVIAELFQSRAHITSDPAPPAAIPNIALPRPVSPDAANAAAPHNANNTARYSFGAGARLSVGVGNASYGGHFGIGRGRYRVQADAWFSHARVSRGSIDAGLAALRLRRAVPLFVSPTLEVELAVSGALGATWALGASDVPGTLVKRALVPYADGRAGAAVMLSPRADFASGFELYGGRAAGLVSRADGEATLGIGGWFVGLEAVLRL